MKKHNTIILTAALSLTALLSAGGSMTANAQGWVQQGPNWYYTDAYGHYVTYQWIYYNNLWYYMGSDGRMLTNSLVEDGSGVYYVDENGVMVVNQWRQIYDIYEQRSYWYWFQANGAAKADGYLTINGVRYHFSNYRLDEGWSDDDNYYYGNGQLNQAGWHYIKTGYYRDFDEGWYYTDKNGKLYKNCEKKINGAYYYFNSNGLMQEGWVEYRTDDGMICKYYRPGNGDRITGWIWFDGESYYDVREDKRTTIHPEGYYYLKNGQPYTSERNTSKISDSVGVKKIDDKYYAFDKVGTMQYGIVKGYGGKLYYFGAENDGSMKTGRVTVEYDDKYGYEGTTMYFENAGSVTASKGAGVTGEAGGYLYKNGELVESDSGYQIVIVGGKTYVVNENGRVKTSGTFYDEYDQKWSVSKNQGGGYTVKRV